MKHVRHVACVMVVLLFCGLVFDVAPAQQAEKGQFSVVTFRYDVEKIKWVPLQSLGSFATREAAMTAADDWHRSKDFDGGFVYEIKGPGEGSELTGTLELINDVRAKLDQISTVTEDYAKLVIQVYKNVKKLREELPKVEKNASKKTVGYVNSMIDQWNDTYETTRRLPGPGAATLRAAIARIDRVTDPLVPGVTKTPEPTFSRKVESARYTVWVHKLVNNEWVRQDERTLVSDDIEKARAYVADVNRYRGWTATSNLPQEGPPAIRTDNASSKEIAAAVPSELVGWWKNNDRRTVGKSGDNSLLINSDGSVVFKQTYVDSVKGKYTINGNRIRIRTEGGWTGKHQWEFDGIIDGNSITGTGRTPSMSTKAVPEAFTKQ